MDASGPVGFADHFSAFAARYAAYRPRYPEGLTELLADRCPGHAVAWDIGCGNGQLSVALARRFAHVIATDPAQAQLDHAEADPRVEYRRAPAEVSGLGDASVDLAVAAQAAHWFDWPRFVPEVGRVVRPGGLIALISYRDAEVAGPPGERLATYYEAIAPYWPNGRRHVNNGYAELVFPWPDVAAPPVAMTAPWTCDELVGYITTWSATSRYVAAHGTGLVDDLRRDLAAIWPDDQTREVHWGLTVKLTRR
jgi:SAM-dependent methyltransferase